MGKGWAAQFAMARAALEEADDVLRFPRPVGRKEVSGKVDDRVWVYPSSSAKISATGNRASEPAACRTPPSGS